MSDLSGNKIFGAGLATALVMVGLAVITPKFFEITPPTKPGYLIAVAADTSGAAAAADVDTPPDWGTVLPAADVSAGEAKTAVCKACHIFDAAGTNNIGPGLYGVLGRKPGSHPGFSYSAGMTAFGGKQPIWDYQHIYEFLKGPQAYIDGTKMTYQGMKAPQDRINVIAYLHTLGSNLPVPPPNPKAAAPAAAAGAAPPAAPADAAPAAAKAAS
jgi:cytochrome c